MSDRSQDPTMFTSQPIPGRPSPFYVGDRYVADAETARRARKELEGGRRCAWCGRQYHVGHGVFCSRACASAEVLS
jgi:hypothetical protein